MRLLLDQNCSAHAAELLRADGIDAMHTRDVGLSKADDVDLLAWCRAERRTMITLDADLHALLAHSRATQPSVIRIRIEGLRDAALAAIIRRVVFFLEEDLERGCAVSVTESKIRLHQLPLAEDR